MNPSMVLIRTFVMTLACLWLLTSFLNSAAEAAQIIGHHPANSDALLDLRIIDNKDTTFVWANTGSTKILAWRFRLISVEGRTVCDSGDLYNPENRPDRKTSQRCLVELKEEEKERDGSAYIKAQLVSVIEGAIGGKPNLVAHTIWFRHHQ